MSEKNEETKKETGEPTLSSDEHALGKMSDTSKVYIPLEVLDYRGPTSRQQTIPPDGISIVDFVSSEKNEENIDKLLSFYEIPFFMERPQLGWKGVVRRMTVTIPKEHYQQVIAIFDTAVQAGMLEKREDIEGLSYY